MNRVSRGGRWFRPGAMPKVFGDTAATLIVDDDPDGAEVLARVLTRDGYACTVTSSAEEARSALRQRSFSLALVDVMLPGENGLELVADLLDHHPTLAVVMVTGVGAPDIADLAIESGAYGYVIKPFTAEQLLVTVANAGHRRCLEIERNLYEQRRAETDAQQFVRRVAHDLNNLLGAIGNYRSFVEQDIAQAERNRQSHDWSSSKRDLSQIDRAVGRAAQLTSELLSWPPDPSH